MSSRASIGGHPIHPTLPIILSIVGVVGLAIAGWLGGELVFKHGVAVSSRSDEIAFIPQSRSHNRAA